MAEPWHHSGAMIPADLLTAHGARLVPLRKGEVLFDQGSPARYFFLVHRGEIKMVSYNEQGREFAQGFFTAGQSFGEPPFFDEGPYPASAVAVSDSEVWRCEREAFLALLRDEPAVHLALTRVLCRRLMYKSMMLAEIAVEEAEHRLATLIEYLRRHSGLAAATPYLVPFTRQELADMTGLRVETVVRTIKSMEQRGWLRIEERKIVWVSREDGPPR
jgi:CRP-like cAMP-binding protein